MNEYSNTTDCRRFIAWSPNWSQGHFGTTADEAMNRACYPYDLDDQRAGWAILQRAGWRVDPFAVSADEAKAA